VLSDALLRHPADPELAALLQQALEIRYPEPLPLPDSPARAGRGAAAGGSAEGAGPVDARD
jgi:hypothetical protein